MNAPTYSRSPLAVGARAAGDRMSIRRGQCIHFNGMQNAKCAAGVHYEEAFGPEVGLLCRAPCIQESRTHERINGKLTPVYKPWDRQGQGLIPCDKFRMPTQEQIRDADVALEKSMDRMRVVMIAIKDWRNAKPRGKQTVIDCPTLCGGKLHLSQSSCNGHVHGRCTTDGCVNWME